MSGSEPDWYAVLGAMSSSSRVELRRLHRQSVKQQHPDSTQHLPEGHRAVLAADFIEVTAAWAVLGDPEARAAYDLRTGVTEARRSAARQAAERRTDRERTSRPDVGAASQPRVPTPRSAPPPAPPAGADHHEHLAVSEGRLSAGVMVTDSRTGAAYGPYFQAGVFRIRAHGHPSAAGGAPGYLVLHVTVDEAVAPVEGRAEPGRRGRWGAALRSVTSGSSARFGGARRRG